MNENYSGGGQVEMVGNKIGNPSNKAQLKR